MNTYKGVVAALVFGAVFMFTGSVAHAQTVNNVNSLMERIQGLLAQVEDLKEQLYELRGEVRAEIKAGLEEGMTDEDIEDIQEILATDPTIYPQGLVTGYFGPLTRNALTRFQQKFELKATGDLNEETRLYLEELLKERFGERVPTGLLRAPGIREKIELRLEEGCDNSGSGKAFFCQKIRIKIESDDDDDNDGGDREDADGAIDEARDEISELEDAIGDANDDDDGYDLAVEKLDEANKLLEDAEAAYDNEDYDRAKERADEAEDAADEGLDALDDDDSEDEEDDDDDNEDDDD